MRGGGLYAVGYALTFVFLEVRTVISEIAGAESIGDFFSNQLFEFVFRFLGDSLRNMIQAFMWPVEIVTLAPPLGAIGLGIAFLVFDKVLRGPIEQWLADGKVTDPSVQEPGV